MQFFIPEEGPMDLFPLYLHLKSHFKDLDCHKLLVEFLLLQIFLDFIWVIGSELDFRSPHHR